MNALKARVNAKSQIIPSPSREPLAAGYIARYQPLRPHATRRMPLPSHPFAPSKKNTNPARLRNEPTKPLKIKEHTKTADRILERTPKPTRCAYHANRHYPPPPHLRNEPRVRSYSAEHQRVQVPPQEDIGMPE